MIAILARYGAIPEVARCRWPLTTPPGRSQTVVLSTHRGPELGTVLDVLRPRQEPGEEAAPQFEVLRVASEDDLQQARVLRERSSREFSAWQQRIADWGLDLQLIDLEWTIDGQKLVLYVLNERGPESTKLALQAAAAGLGLVEVQPVGSDGPMTLPSGGGCGSCGCH